MPRRAVAGALGVFDGTGQDESVMPRGAGRAHSPLPSSKSYQANFKIRGWDKGKYFKEYEIDIDLQEESKNRTCVSPTNPSPRHFTSKTKINLTIIRISGTTAMFTLQVRVIVEGHLHP
jgi:hypothetical protein